MPAYTQYVWVACICVIPRNHVRDGLAKGKIKPSACSFLVFWS